MSETIGIILGSGLGEAANAFEILESKPLESVVGGAVGGKTPPLGHHRRVLRAHYRGRDLVVMQGRLHGYEGFSAQLITEPIRYMKGLGVSTVILSFAAGATRRKFRPKDLIVLSDHIHAQSGNPLTGTTEFIDCTEVYDVHYQKILLTLAKKLKIRAFPGVYLSTDGPSYETPAEVRAFARWGADVVGMSVTAEALVARSLGIKVVGLGWVSNMASGIVPRHKLSHQEVLDLASEAKEPFSRLLCSFLERI